MAEKLMVVIIGIRPGSDRDAVVQNLARLIKSDPDRIETLLKKPSVVKTGLDGPAAEKYRAALERAGVLAKVMPVKPALAGSASAESRTGHRKAEPRGKPLETCPNCGYEAYSPDDPLIVGHGGEGECLRCGVVRKKYLRAKAARQQGDAEAFSPENAAASPAAVVIEKSNSRLFDLLSNPGGRYGLVAVLIVLFAIGAIWIARDEQPNGAGDGKVAAAASGDKKGEAVTSQKESTFECTIPPGQTGTVKVIGYVPYILNPEAEISVSAEYDLLGNTWAGHGVDVRVYKTDVIPENHDIWSVKAKMADVAGIGVDPVYRLVNPGGQIDRSLLAYNMAAEKHTIFVHTFIQGELIEMGRMALPDAQKNWKYADKSIEAGAYELKSWIFYPFTMTVNVTVPDEASLQATQEGKSTESFGLLEFGRRRTESSSGKGGSADKPEKKPDKEVRLNMAVLPASGGGYEGIGFMVNTRSAGAYELICE